MTDPTLRRTPLHDAHIASGARMVPFAGWEMPVQYAGVLPEVKAVRESVGCFDVSHMGRLRIVGPGALGYVERLVVSDPSVLGDAQGQYSLMCNAEGGVIDDIIAYRMGPEEFRIVYNAGCLEKDRAWFAECAIGHDVVLDDESDRTALIAVQGPAAIDLLGPEVAALPRFGIGTVAVLGFEVLAARTGYTGEDGAELFAPAETAEGLWNALLAAGVVPCGLGARDTLRVEAALPLYGHEMDETVDPFSARLGWVVKLDRVAPIQGGDALAARKAAKPHVTIGVAIEGRGIPREGYSVRLPGGDTIGGITSGTFSPTLAKGIGLARVATGKVRVGDPIEVLIRDTPFPARVAKLPFVKNV